MQYWLFKSEPNTWSWDDQVKKGDEGEGWDGVRNYQASNNMKAMKIGDLGFFYHSVHEKQIVGIVEVSAEYHPDHTDASGRFGMVDVKAVKSVTTNVTLADIKDYYQQTMLNPKAARLNVQLRGTKFSDSEFADLPNQTKVTSLDAYYSDIKLQK